MNLVVYLNNRARQISHEYQVTENRAYINEIEKELTLKGLKGRLTEVTLLQRFVSGEREEIND